MAARVELGGTYGEEIIVRSGSAIGARCGVVVVVIVIATTAKFLAGAYY